MRYIDKNLNLAEGNRYTSDFLQEAFNVEEACFYPDVALEASYSNFSSRKYRYGEGLEEGRNGLEPLLVSEQGNYCCYCMGRIESHDVALEHIVPRNFDEEQNPADEFAYYAGYAPMLSEHVELAGEFAKRRFTNKEEIKKQAKYPHLVSYVNLVASCHGIIGKKGKTSCFCNHPRGNKRIIPLMLMNETSAIVKYNEVGMIIVDLPAKGEAKDTVEALQLNHDTLQEIRMLWYKISRTNRTVEEVVLIDNLKDRILLLKEIFNIADYTQLDERWKKYAPSGKEKAMAYWNLFIKYDWFYGYYKVHYPLPVA